MKITQEVHLHARQPAYKDKPDFSVLSFKDDGASFGPCVASAMVEFVLPASWNPIAAELAMLEAKKRAAMDEYQRTVQQINEQISRLTAITNEVA